MAKIAFSKLNKVKNLPAKTVQIGENTIEVEQYLPLEEKMNIIVATIDQSGNGEEGFFNIVKLDTFYKIEMISAYTNITFTEKQLEDTPKLFDAIVLNEIWDAVSKEIPEEEKDYIWNSILSLAKETTAYNNSVLGILKTVSSDYSSLNLDATQIQNALSDPNSLGVLSEVLSKIG